MFGGDDVSPGLAYPGNRLPPFASSAGLGHAAVFPVGLPEFFVKAYTDEGDTVFDPFMGSGTTMIAADKHGRTAIGCELSTGYCDVIAHRWVANTGKSVHIERGGTKVPFKLDSNG